MDQTYLYFAHLQVSPWLYVDLVYREFEKGLDC
jgi:hypothetical protein